VVGEADPAAADELAQVGETPVLREPDLRDVAAALLGCRGMVGNDSGISHLAAAIGIPVLALFGPTDPARWAPRGARTRHLAAPGRDLSALSTDTVARALLDLLDPP